MVKGASGMAGELGHVHIPMAGLLADDQPIPRCNCGFVGDAESVASLTGIENNLLPYWLTQFPDPPPDEAGRQVRAYGEAGDETALRIFEQQAMALGRLFTIAANYTDPNVYFLGGGVVESTPAFRDWFMGKVRERTCYAMNRRAWPASQLYRTLTWLGGPGHCPGGSDNASETVRRPGSPIAAAHPIRWSAVGKPATFGGSEPSLNECRR